MSHELYTPSPFANDPWEDISLNFILDLPRTTKGLDSIFMDMDKLFLKEVTSLHDLSSNLVLDRALIPNDGKFHEGLLESCKRWRGCYV